MIEIIPAIDLIDAKCVRLTEGDYSTKKVYDSDPVAVAKRFEQVGVRRLHLVDLDGAKAKTVVNHAVLKAITTQTNLQVDFGGGIATNRDIELAYDCGAAQVVCGSIAAKNSEQFVEWLKKYGAERLVLGADVKDGMIAIDAWQAKTEVGWKEFISNYQEWGIKYVVCTEIARDGKLEGPAYDLYKQIREQFPDIKLIASGGVHAVDDIKKLDDLEVYGVIIGKALYENKIDISRLGELLC